MHTTKAGDNIFLDLGFPPEEAVRLKIRSDLMIRLARHIEEQVLTQQGAAEIMGVTQPRISDLVRGKHERFSIDMLIGMAVKAGLEVEVRIAA